MVLDRGKGRSMEIDRRLIIIKNPRELGHGKEEPVVIDAPTDRRVNKKGVKFR